MSIGFCKTFSLSKNKSLEIQLDLFDKDLSTSYFEFMLTWTRKCDHAGPSFLFSIFRTVFFNIQIYDNRHWDYDNNCWEKYDKI
jgi:hypothetical protein